jgi:hypothetical protein
LIVPPPPFSILDLSPIVEGGDAARVREEMAVAPVA